MARVRLSFWEPWGTKNSEFRAKVWQEVWQALHYPTCNLKTACNVANRCSPKDYIDQTIRSFAPRSSAFSQTMGNKLSHSWAKVWQESGKRK